MNLVDSYDTNEHEELHRYKSDIYRGEREIGRNYALAMGAYRGRLGMAGFRTVSRPGNEARTLPATNNKRTVHPLQ